MSNSSAGDGLHPESWTASHLTDDALAHVVSDLGHLAGGPLGIWRNVVVKRLLEVREVLVHEHAAPTDWLHPGRSALVTERETLLERVAAMRHMVLTDDDAVRASADVRLLVADVRRHLHRLGEVEQEEALRRVDPPERRRPAVPE